MRRPIVMWLVRWFVDVDTPRWLQRMIDRDSALQEYDRRLRSVENRLRNDASDWRQQFEPGAKYQPAQRTSRETVHRHQIIERRRQLGASVVACGLAFTFIYFGIASLAGRDVSNATSPEVAQVNQQAIGTSERERMQAGADSLVILYKASRQGLLRSVDGIPSILNKANDLKIYPQAAVNQNAKKTLEATSRAYGRTLALVNRSLVDHRHRIANDARGFFNSIKKRVNQRDETTRIETETLAD